MNPIIRTAIFFLLVILLNIYWISFLIPYKDFYDYESVLFIFTVCLFCVICCLKLGKGVGNQYLGIKISAVEPLVFMLTVLIVLCARSTYSRIMIYTNVFVLDIIFSLILYYFSKFAFSIFPELKGILILSLVLMGFIMSLFIDFQILNKETNSSLIINILSNPTTYGIYQGCIITISLAFLLFKRNLIRLLFVSVFVNQIFWYGIVITILGIELFALSVSYSRVSMISCFAGCAIILYFKYMIMATNKQKSLKHTFIIQRSILLILVIGFFTFLFGIFSHNNSTEGRIFIGKLGFELAKNAPLNGFGLNSFGEKYNLYQAEYFLSGQGTFRQKYLADNINYALNEYLQIAIEFGIIGLTFLLFTISYILWKILTQKIFENNIFITSCVGGVLSIIFVSAMFTYSFHMLFLMVIGIIFLSMFDFAMLTTILITFRPVMYAVIILVIFFCSFSIYSVVLQSAAVNKWKAAQLLAGSYKFSISKELYKEARPYLNTNSYFLFDYGLQLYNNGYFLESIRIFTQGNVYFSSYQTYMYMGLAYQNLCDYENALKYFKISTNMVPNRFVPKYYLYKLYGVMDKKKQADALKFEILHMPIKVPSKMIEFILWDIQDDH